MLKNKPFFIAAIVFGSLSLLFTLVAALSFLMGDNTLSHAVPSLLHLEANTFTNATFGQLAVVLSIPSFIFAFRSISDES